MFKVKTYLDKSGIHGIGLFSKNPIKAGTIIYVPNKDLDLLLDKGQFQKLSKNEKDTIKHFGYNTKDHKWHLSFDNIRFCNHSKSKNNISIGNNGYLYAIKDIPKNKELLQNYSEFEILRPILK